MKNYCGLDCAQCPAVDSCPGCAATGGKPFGGTCVLGECCKAQGLEYTLPGGQKVKFWEDGRVYLGNQLEKQDGSCRCYGLTADENWLLVCEYGDNGSDPELVVYKRREK